MVATAEIAVVEEEALASKEDEVDVVMVDVNKDNNNNRRNRLTPHSIKERFRPQSVRFVGRLATLPISVGSGLHRLVVLIHLDVARTSPEVEIEVHTGQSVVHKVVEEEGSPQWLTTSHMEYR